MRADTLSFFQKLDMVVDAVRYELASTSNDPELVAVREQLEAEYAALKVRELRQDSEAAVLQRQRLGLMGDTAGLMTVTGVEAPKRSTLELLLEALQSATRRPER